MDVENRQTHKQAAHKGFWFSFLLIHYSLQAVPKRYFSKQMQRRRDGGRKKNQKRFPLVLFKAPNPPLKIPMCKLGLITHCVWTACVNVIQLELSTHPARAFPPQLLDLSSSGDTFKCAYVMLIYPNVTHTHTHAYAWLVGAKAPQVPQYSSVSKGAPLILIQLPCLQQTYPLTHTLSHKLTHTA